MAIQSKEVLNAEGLQYHIHCKKGDVGKYYHPFAQWCWQVLYLLGFLDMTSLYLMIFGVLMPLMIRYSIFSSRS